MISYRDCLILVCYILVVYSLESVGESASPKLLCTIIPLKTDSWWKIYTNNSSNHSGVSYDDEVALKFNETVLRLSEDSGSVFNWEVDMKLPEDIILPENGFENQDIITRERSNQISSK